MFLFLRYLYHPESQRNEENQPNGESHRIMDSLAEGVDMRRHSLRRRYMAPYTIMVVDSEVESDVGDANSDSGGETTPPPEDESGETSSRKRNLWSPSSDSSNDANPSPGKRPHLVFSNSDSDVDNEESHEARNGHYISEIVDSNASESEVEISRIGASSPSVGTSVIANGETSLQGTETNRNGVSDSNGVTNLNLTISNGNVGEHEADLNGDCNVSDGAVPISSISIDDSGSLSFDTDNSSLLSSLEIQNNVDVAPSVSTSMCEKVYQNGETESGTNYASVSGENSTLGASPSGQGRLVGTELLNGVQASENVNGTDDVNSRRKVSFTFKKRVQSSRNYRKHEDDLWNI